MATVASTVAEEESTDPSLVKFTRFSEASDLQEITSSFKSLCDEIDIDPFSESQDFYSSLKERLQQWRCKALWQLLDKRASMEEYRGGSASRGKRVLVIGAGPVGLRFAIEAALLGASVHLVEKRNSFSRNNVLHLWPFLIDDLKSLGAKKFYGKFCAGAIDHISIKILQCVLLKICLLLGVKVHYPVTFQDYIEPQSESAGWKIIVSPATDSLSSQTYDAIIAADGKQYSVRGFRSKEFRAKLAIAITVNFVNRNTQQEAAVEEISGVAYIYNQSFFKNLAQAHGIELENIVYYKDETHYFVMTAKRNSLLAKGVLKRDFKDPDMLLSPRNISKTALESYAIEAATFSTKGGLGSVEFALNHKGENDVAIFDFTSLFASENASRIVERKGKRLLLCQIGDSLLEPFWPTGSGLARGFLGGFDAAWMLKHFCEGQETPLKLIEEREALFRLLPSTIPEKLQKKFSSYSINPQSRYPHLNLTPTSDLSHLYDSDTKPQVVKKEENKEQQQQLNAPKVKRFHSMEVRSPRRTGQSLQQDRPVKPSLDTIRASLSPPPPPPPHSSPSHLSPSTHTHLPSPLVPSLSQEYEIIERPEEPAPEPITRKKSTGDFSLIKFAKMLFLGHRGSKAGTPERVGTPEGRTPEHKRAGREKGKERRKSKSKSPGKMKGQSDEAETSREKQGAAINTSTPSPTHHSKVKTSPVKAKATVKTKSSPVKAKSSPLKTKNTAVTTVKTSARSGPSPTGSGAAPSGSGAVQNLTRLYETHSTSSSPLPVASSPSGGGMSSSASRPVAQGTVASVIKKLEERGGEDVDCDDLITDQGIEQEITDFEGAESYDDKIIINESLAESVSIVLDQEEEEEEEEEEVLFKGRSHTVSEASRSNYLRQKEDGFDFISRAERRKSKDDSVILQSSTAATVSHYTPQWLQNFTDSLTKSLESLREETSDLYQTKTALDILNFAFSNIISDPEEDTYRRIRSTSDRFHNHVYQFNSAQEFLWLCGWVEVGEYLVLPLHQQLEVPKKALDRQLEIVGLKLQSSHIDNVLLSKRKVSQDYATTQCYTDSIVSEALKKSRRDQSVMMATALKEMTTKTESANDDIKQLDEIDNGRLTREEEKAMMLSASLAREWWERKLVKRPSTYSLYFQHDELDDMKLFADTELLASHRGMVNERIKAFEPSSSEYTSSDEEEEEEEGIDDEGEEGKEERAEGFPIATQSSQASGTQSLGLSLKMWEERSQGLDVPDSSVGNDSSVKPITCDDESEANPTHLKWLEATKASERILQMKQQREEQEPDKA